MKTLITGGSGFIGSHLAKNLTDKGYEVTILSRTPFKIKNYKSIGNLDDIANDEFFDVIVNLAGANISKKWTDDYKKELIESRVETTENIVSLIKRLENQPKLLINASAVGYYGLQGDNVLTENSEHVEDFTHSICKKWEDEAQKINDLGVRLCITRLGVVLGKNEGALKKMLPSFKLGLGGKIGDGKQYFSWVHIDDVISCYMFLINNEQAKGIYNVTAPNPVTNSKFTKSLAKSINRPALFTVPACVIKCGFGEMGENLLLKGQRVIPQKLTKEGFIYQYPFIDDALVNLVR